MILWSSGTPKANFPLYQENFKQALQTFFDEEWPCEARHPRLQERCIIVRTRHNTKGHQLASGKVWSGKYETQRNVDIEPIFTDAVLTIFNNLANALMNNERRQASASATEEKQIAFGIHMRDIMHKRCKFLRESSMIVSHLICLCCLYQVPVHPLLCGHTVCDDCFCASGGQAREHVVRLQWCPVCGVNWSQGRANVEIVKKPENCGIRVLSLDG
jgi:hypothetical protein